MPIFCKNIVRSLKHTCSYAHILYKKRPFSQKQIALILFFSNFSLKTPGVHAHIWSKILQFCQNFTLWTKKSIGCLFFPIFPALMPIYFHNNVHSLKTHCSHAHILSKKRPFSQKHCALMSIFSIFSWKPPYCHAHIWSKTIILSKLHYITSQNSQ